MTVNPARLLPDCQVITATHSQNMALLVCARESLHVSCLTDAETPFDALLELVEGLLV